MASYSDDMSSTPYVYDSFELFNVSYSTEIINCYGYVHDATPEFGEYCNVTFDSILCWPYTPAGTVAVNPCPHILNGVRYDTNKNALKRCYPNGTWDNYTDYMACTPLPEVESNSSNGELTRLIYFIGYSASLVAVIIALGIFLNFKDLRCLRNTFHVNLLATYFLNALFWIITASLHVGPDSNHMAPCVFMAIVYYCQGTNFFWMFVEGFYLYMLVVRTFTVDKIRFRVYIFIGWGVPAIVVAVWAIVKAKLAQGTSSMESPGMSNCPWMVKDSFEWIYSGPILLVLVVNMLFLGRIMWVLITKLRAATTAESQQYRKAAKALLVLIPLLGITYVVVLVAPEIGVFAVVLDYTRAVLISTQGFTVSVLYCFLNGEVKNTLHHHFEAWRSSRNLPGGQRFSCRYRDGSPRSRTESIRLCSAVTADCRCDANNANRESCVSCLTTHSFVGNGHSTSSVGNKLGNNYMENQLLVVAQTTGNDVDGTHSHLARSVTTSTVNSIRENSV